MLGLGRARPSTVGALLRDFISRDPSVRIEAADASSFVVGSDAGEPRARVIAGLVKMLDADGSPQARSAAALALSDLHAIEALPALLIAAEDDAPLVRQLAITALGEIGDGRARERIRRALGDPRPEVRFQAIVAFPRVAKGQGDDGQKEAWSALRGALDDDDAQVRSRAAEACAELADAAELPSVVADRLAKIVVDCDETVDARVAAAIALGESSDRRGAKVLLDVIAGKIDEPNPARVQAAFELAGELGLDDARAAARAAAFGFRARFGDPGRRTAALIALCRLGDRRAIDHVLAELQASSFARRMLAVAIAGRAALIEAGPGLAAMRTALRTAPRLADAQALDDALARIDDASSTPPREPR